MNNLKLSPYQEIGKKFLSERKLALLADDMGLGKTAQTISAAIETGAAAILIICPAVARVNWKREFKMWAGLNFTVCEKLGDELSMLSVVSYDFATENALKLADFAWDIVICDESHFIKEPSARRTKAVYGKNGIIRNSDRLWCLSGTPAPNHAAELWPMLFTFGVTKKSYDEFVEAYCDTRLTYYHGRNGRKIVGTKKSAIAEIKQLLDGVMLRRLKSEVLSDMPPISFEQLSVEGTPLPEVIKLDQERLRSESESLEFSLSKCKDDFEQMAFMLEKLGDSVSTLRRYVGLQKVQSVASIIKQELKDKAYKKIVIFAIHTDVIEQLRLMLLGHGPVVVNGKVSPKRRQENIDRFQNDPKCQVFLGNIAAAGTAITLTAANQVLFVEQSWVPGENAQAADRCHRRGQELPVTVRIAALADSIDEKVTSVLTRKATQLRQIFDEGENHANA